MTAKIALSKQLEPYLSDAPVGGDGVTMPDVTTNITNDRVIICAHQLANRRGWKIKATQVNGKVMIWRLL
jgi:hypothetical protein